MVAIENVRAVGAALIMFLDDGSVVEFAPTAGGFWYPTSQIDVTPTPDPEPDPDPDPNPGDRTGFIYPLPFGPADTPWEGYPGHNGYDFAVAAGTTIRNPGPPGTVLFNGFGGAGNGWNGLGNFVLLDHGTVRGDRVFTGYAHMLAQPSYSTGTVLASGAKIGEVGSTGNSSGPHLHWMTMVGTQWNWINPETFVSRYPA